VRSREKFASRSFHTSANKLPSSNLHFHTRHHLLSKFLITSQSHRITEFFSGIVNGKDATLTTNRFHRRERQHHVLFGQQSSGLQREGRATRQDHQTPANDGSYEENLGGSRCHGQGTSRLPLPALLHLPLAHTTVDQKGI
jgi:hypothetical protein